MCAEHRGGAHQDDEAKSEQFSLRGKKSPQARSHETQVGGSMGLWLGLGKIFTPEKYLPLKNIHPSQVGGSMGLWLGLGVLQAAEIATNFFLAQILPRIVNKLSNGDQILAQQ